jgi:acyl-CoA hydrolase
MQYYSRKLIKPGDLNSHGTLFGGTLLSWIDEEAAIFANCQLEGRARLVTKFMSEINFVSSAVNGDIIEVGMETSRFGSSSITVRCNVRKKFTQESIITIEKIVFVNVDENGNSAPHAKANQEITSSEPTI